MIEIVFSQVYHQYRQYTACGPSRRLVTHLLSTHAYLYHFIFLVLFSMQAQALNGPYWAAAIKQQADRDEPGVLKVAHLLRHLSVIFAFFCKIPSPSK